MQLRVQPYKDQNNNQSQSQTDLAKKKQGHWTFEEHQKYLHFFQKLTPNPKPRRIFNELSKTIGTRTPSQCKSHHQKCNPIQTTNKINNPQKYILKKTKQIVRQLFAKQRERTQKFKEFQ